MYTNKERLFRLQVFQQTISTLSMCPLRLYNNNCYEQFVGDSSFQEVLCSIHKILEIDEPFDIDNTIYIIKQKIKKNPKDMKKIIYPLLENFGEKLRESMWLTKPSNSLTFTRDIKDNKRLWLFLMFYDLFSKEFIEENFKTQYQRDCLIGMRNVFVKLNENYTLSVGRILTKEQDSDKIVSDIIKNYNFENMNIFELTKISRRRKIFDKDILQQRVPYLQKAFNIFLDSSFQLAQNVSKKEIEHIAIFIYMVVKENISSCTLQISKHLLIYKNRELKVVIQSETLLDEYPDKFKKYLRKFDYYRDFFLGEYASRIKTYFNKKYSGIRHEDSDFNPIQSLISRICSRLNADGGCYIKYSLFDEKLKLIASHGEASYEQGIKNYIEKINDNDKPIRDKSRVLKVINNYFSSEYKYNIDKLILQKVESKEMLQPLKDKHIRSNIAIPVTFKYKLMGILLIDSFRENTFAKEDINLVLSITSALSVQIFDQIIERNLFRIIKNVPNTAELKDKKLIEERFSYLAKYINKIFFSYGVSIWEYQLEDKEFILKSTTLGIEPNSVKIERGSDDLIQDIPLRENGFKPLVEYDIESSNRFICCSPKKYDKRINAIKIYPIIQNGQILGALSIYNKREEDYRAIDNQSLISVNEHLKVFFNIVSTFIEQKALIQNNALHEISKKLMMIKSNTVQLRELLHENFVQLDDKARYRFGIKLDDIENFTKDVKLSFDFISNGSDEYRDKNLIDYEIENKYKKAQKQNSENNNIRMVVNQLITSIPAPLCYKNIKIKNHVDNIDVSIAHIVLNDIFQNLILNAMKYSFQGTEIKIHSKIKSNSIRIYIKSEGIEITDDERNDIFKYGYRCLCAKNFKEKIGNKEINYIDGEEQNAGIGLYKVNALLTNILSGEIRLKKEKSRFENGEVIIFEIILPITLLRKRG